MFEHYLLGLLIAAYVNYKNKELYHICQSQFELNKTFKNNQTDYRFNK